MKKTLLLGLLLGLSALSMASGGTSTDPFADVKTKLTLEDQGIIITPEADGETSGSVTLDHGTVLDRSKGSITSTQEFGQNVPAVVYIKTSSGQLSAGRKLTLELSSDDNMLKTKNAGTDETKKVEHTLTGTVTNATDAGILELSGGITTATNDITTTGEALQVAFESAITAEALEKKVEGDFTNISTLTVIVKAAPAPGN